MQRRYGGSRKPAGEIFAPFLCDLEVGLDETLGTGRADTQNDLRRQYLELLLKPEGTLGDLFFLRRSINFARTFHMARAALDRVADVNVLAPAQAIFCQGLVQQLTRAAYERSSAEVFLLARPFPNQHQWCSWDPFPEYNVGARGRQLAASASQRLYL